MNYRSNMISHFPFAVLAIPMISAFDNKAGWKLTEDGKAIMLKDGNPVWINADGTESVLQQDTIAKLNNEAKTHREAKEAAEAKLKAFGDLNADEAKKAIATMKNIDAKKLIDAGEVDKVRDTMKAEFAGQITELTSKLNESSSTINTMRIDNVFNGSDFLREGIAVPMDMFSATFRQQFKVDEKGEIIATDKAGNRLMSKKNIGQYATGDEALQLMVDAHPSKDIILRANTGSGTGNNGRGGQNNPKGRTVKRNEYDAMDPAARGELMGQISKGEASLVD